jgi:predicted NBD/HSP70 family sugar kinase
MILHRAMNITQLKADSDQIRRQNRGLVLSTLRRDGPSARIELGRKTDLSPATITSITGDLIAEGLVRCSAEEGAARPGPGRPQVKLALDPDAGLVLGIRVSVDQARFELARYDGEVVYTELAELPSYEAAAEAYSRALAAKASEVLARRNISTRSIIRAGVAVQGIADAQRGAISWSPAFKARNIPVCAALGAALGVDVQIANDTNLMARILAERNGARTGTALVVFIGYGVGMGIIIDGGVYDGPTGAAAEFGHVNHEPQGPMCRCGRRGCVEAYAADYAILRSYTGADPYAEPTHNAVDPARMDAIQAEAAAGGARALAAYRQAGLALGYGIARAIALLNAGRVVVAGPGARAYDMLRPGTEEGFALGLPAPLGEGVVIESASADQDMIFEGLLAQLFGDLDRDVFARPRARRETGDESVARQAASA